MQPEQYFFNNFLYKTVYVKGDSRAPTLDVTFDNVHILNDDIVSAKPHILVKLQSQSPYLSAEGYVAGHGAGHVSGRLAA